VLADTPQKAENVIRLAREQGIAKRTLERAKKKLGVVSELVSNCDVDGRFAVGGHWMWRLPSVDVIGFGKA
jgi:hypothetical protein